MTIACPTPLATTDRVQLGHGSGGKMSAALVRERFLPLFRNDILAQSGVRRSPYRPTPSWFSRSSFRAATSDRSPCTGPSTTWR